MAEFKRGHIRAAKTIHRSDRPNKVTTTEMVKKIYKMVLDNRRLKVRELASIIGISKSTVHSILTENLDMRKMFQSSVGRFFTVILPIFYVDS